MSFCNQCGTPNPDDSTYCNGCGSPLNSQPQQTTYSQPVYSQPNYPQPNYPQPTYSQPTYSRPVYSPGTPATLPTPAKVLSIISLVSGILSCCSLYVGFIFSIAALITGGISKSKTPSGTPNGKSTAGIITGIVGIVLSILWFILFIYIIEEATSTPSYSYYDYYY